MAKLRKIQFYRNGQEQVITNAGGIIGQQTYLVDDLKSAYVYAEASFKQTGKHNEMEDGEILLYRFSYAGQFHTLVGVVHASETTKSLEVLANYDMLGAEISNEIAAAINALDVENVSVATETNGIVTFNGIKQEDGKIATGTTGISLAKVAKTGAAADVSIADTANVITATTVEGALAEIAKEIDAMDLNATDVVALNEGKTALQAGKISEADGKVTVATATNVVEFNQALSSTNKVATMADVTAAQNNATVVGQESIVVADATGADATGKVVSLKIDSTDKVLSQGTDGLKTNLTVDTIKYGADAGEKSGKTYIQIKGINGELISETNAAAFVKDGFLQEVKLIEASVGQENVLRFTWNSDVGIQVTDIKVSDLCDVYTVDDEYLQLNANDKFKIEHKTQSNFTGTNAIKTFGANTATEYTADAAGETVEFKVPSFTVDAAGHVTAASDKTIKVELPAAQTITGETATTQGNYINVKVTATKGENNDNYTLSTTSNVTTQTMAGIAVEGAADGLATASDVKTYVDGKVGAEYTATGELEMSDERVITHKTQDDLPTAAKGSVLTNTINVPVITVNEYGHVTALDQQSYTVKYPTVSGTSGQIFIDSTTNDGVVNYTVKLATVSRIDTNTATDNFSDESNTFTFISGVTTDNYGRVTEVSTTTMTENWDCGTW